MGQNICCPCKDFFNWSSGLENMSQKADFERGLTLAHSCHIMKKGGEKGKLWWEIGEKWRKTAEVG